MVCFCLQPAKRKMIEIINKQICLYFINIIWMA